MVKTVRRLALADDDDDLGMMMMVMMMDGRIRRILRVRVSTTVNH